MSEIRRNIFARTMTIYYNRKNRVSYRDERGKRSDTPAADSRADSKLGHQRECRENMERRKEMQKNIRRIVGTLAFWAVVFIVWWGVNDVLRIKVGESTDMIHSFYEMEENTLDVLCVGSSHSYHSIQPNLLWGNYGIPSYVLSSPGQSVPCSYYLLKEALKYQSPKVVLLETYLFREENKYRTQERLRQAIDGIRFGETKVELIEDFFPDYSWKEKLFQAGSSESPGSSGETKENPGSDEGIPGENY